MKITLVEPPRAFEVGLHRRLIMKDCAHIVLSPDEQVTMLTESGNEYDVARKSWGFYATPSLNGRLQNYHLHAVLVKNRLNQFFLMLIEAGKEAEFQSYLTVESLQVVCWMDDTEKLERIEYNLKRDGRGSSETD